MAETDIPAPADLWYLEDHVPGQTWEFGPILVEEKEIIEFARRYDPQVFHMDPEGAKKTSFGGLVASGWLTACLAMRLIVEGRLLHMANMGSPGIDEVRWLKPVRPGDRLSVKITLLEVRRSRSKPDRGIIRGLVEIMNQRGEVVTSWKGMNMVRTRTPFPA
jgi:acyl dehydratase